MVCPNGLVMIWDPLERFLWGIAITIALICGIYFMRIAKKREVFNERIIMLGLASLPIGFAFSLLFTFFQGFQIEGNFNGNVFCGNYDSTRSLYMLFAQLSYVSFGIGGIFFVLAFEIIVKRSKYLLTIVFIIIITVVIFSRDLDMSRWVFSFLLIPGLIILVPLVLFLYTKWSHLEFKAVSSFLLFGFLLFMISLNLAHRAHKLINVYPLILSPLLLILGCCIIILPTIIDPKVISRALPYWVLYAIITSALLITILSIDIIKRFNYYFILEFLGAIFYICILYFLVIKDIRSDIISESQKILKAEEDIKTDFLKMFTRPQQVSFLASISHELRTPLTSIIGFTRMMLKGSVGDINKEQENQLNIILNSANHLHELITDVIDMTKIEVNKFNIRKEKFDFIKELKNMKQTFNLAIKEKELDFFMDTPDNLIIYNDKKRVNQILFNLIGNAVKFTEKGKILIKIRSTKREITISVKDTGPGIKEEDLNKLFIPFSRIAQPEKFKEGAGLGLHISKKLASLLGGEILVKSKFGKGSTFKLILKIEDEVIPN